MTIEEVSKMAEEIRANSPSARIRWPREFKLKIVELRRNGESIANLSRATGILDHTIRSWIPPVNSKKGYFKQIVEKPVLSNLIVRWDEGPSIEGMSFEQLKILLREVLL